VPSLGQLWSRRSGLGPLLVGTLGLAALIVLALELWRPGYFLTDDNLSGYFPTITEAGRHLQHGQSPFVSDYVFGGHFHELRDVSCNDAHPLVLAVSLLAGTPFRFWIVDLIAVLFLALAVAGFTVLAHALREEYSLPIPDGYLIFYTLSFVFGSYMLTIGPSWISFLANQGCLPWLALGILSKSPLRGTFLVALFTIHGLLAGYPGLLISGGLCLSVFALAVAVSRRSILPLFCWGVGNVMAVLLLAPLLLLVLDGFGHTLRIQGMSLADLSLFSMPPATFFNSFFMGNWSEILARWQGGAALARLDFPYLTSILACPAAWCVWLAFFGGRWRFMDKLCLGLALALVLLIVRPGWLAVIMYHLPVFRSMRWPFREGLLFLFFIHLFLVLRFPEKPPRWQTAVTVFSFLMFVLPLPFIRPPSLNPLALDRQLLFSGRAETYWRNVKATLQPSDEIATVINYDFWLKNRRDVPYTLLGTANFPEYFQVRCIVGYSTTAPTDEVPVKTVPGYWFGAFRDDQVPALLAERPDLKLIRIESTDPLRITLSTGAGPAVDLTPLLPK
jgi:hypothetical protein